MQKTDTVSSTTQHITIFKGELFIQGWFSNWKPRYCQLCTSRKLSFYYNSTQINNSKPILIIDLSTVISLYDNIHGMSAAELSPRSRSYTTSQSIDYSHSPHSLSNKDKFAFCLETSSSDKYVFGCDDEDVLDQWIKHLNVYVFGDIIHSGYMIKQGHKFKTWKKRWFTLSSHWRELRYYENNIMTQNTYKGKVDLSMVNILRYGDKINYGFEYTIELILPFRTYVFVNTYHELRENWMRRMEQVLKGYNYCQICGDTQCMNTDKKIYYKMNVIHEGYLNLFTGNMQNPWKQSYYAIDGKTIRLFYTNTISKMDQFQSCVIKKEYYEKYISEHLEGYYLLLGETIEVIDCIQTKKDNKKHTKNNEYHPIETYIIGEGEQDDDDENNKIIIAGPGYGDSNESKDDSKDNIDNIDYIEPIDDAPGYAPAYLDINGYHIDKNIELMDMKKKKEDDGFYKAFKKYKYKFSIGDDIFGLNDIEEVTKWINALKTVTDLSKRDTDKYDDERNYLCLIHLDSFIYGFMRNIKKFETMSLNVTKCIVQYIGDECWDNTALITF